MSYYEQAKKINGIFREFYDKMPIEPNVKFIEGILWFGQVAKFRCRSNAAYDNFCKAVFEGIVNIERTKKEGFDFDVLQVKEVVKDVEEE